MTSLFLSNTLEVSALSSSLSPDKSHYLRIFFYGDAEGTVPTLQLYIEALLCDDFQIDHFKILDTMPLILETELFLYFMLQGGLAKWFPPRLVDWEAHLWDILNTIHDLPTILHQEFA